MSFQTHMVAAFEQSLVSMSQKLEKLTLSKDNKDTEIQEMRQTIELLRQQSAGIAATQLLALSSTQGATSGGNTTKNVPPPPSNTSGPAHEEMRRHHSSDSMHSITVMGHEPLSGHGQSQGGGGQYHSQKKKSGLRHSLQRAFSRNNKNSGGHKNAPRPISQSSNPDFAEREMMLLIGGSGGQYSNGTSRENVSVSPSAYVGPPSLSPTSKCSSTSSSSPEQNGDQHITYDRDGNPVVEHLVKQLREKDLVLTDIRLEALTTASQVESLKDTVMRMRQEMISLKQNNDRLQQMVVRRSMTGSDISLGGSCSSPTESEPRRYSATAEYLSNRPPMELPLNLDEGDEDCEPPPPAPEPLSPAFIADMSPGLERSPPILDEIMALSADTALESNIEGKKIAIAVYLGQMELFGRYLEEMNESGKGREKPGRIKQNEFTIAFTFVCGKTSWPSLDYIVRRSFNDFLERVDPAGNLGLTTESISSYHLGEATRAPEVHLPELLPCGYTVGNVDTLYICLRGVSNVAIDNLIIKNMVLRYKSSAVVDPRRNRTSQGSADNN
ncbi:protein sickie-like [Uranotaenia lowii]|uniref:protein sickie-like n=1 Tax=Uranotaenia lowii TaxID=190385 RepID=UPI002479E42E|nr:protein sickie-like [Uranotaenia lowii]